MLEFLQRRTGRRQEYPVVSRETPVLHLGALSRSGAAPSRNLDIGGQVGRRVSGRFPGGCSYQRDLASKRSSLRVFRPRRPSRLPPERWSTFLSRQACSARRYAVPVRQPTSVRFPISHPCEFPSGTPACSYTNTQRSGCNMSCPGAQGPPIPTRWSVTKPGRKI